MSESINGQWVITLFPRSFLAQLDPRAFMPETRGGMLCGTILHELQHKCVEQYGGGSGESDSDPNSCEHIAITYGTLAKLCGEMTSLFMQYRLASEPDPDIEGRLKGFCSYYRFKEDQYNNEGSAAKAEQCKCGGWAPSPNCPATEYPPATGPCPEPYPDNQLIPPCIPCAHFLPPS